MDIRESAKEYLEYCEFRKGLDWNTLKAYRIDLKQFFDFIASQTPQKTQIEAYITEMHKKYKQKTIKRKLASIKAFYKFLEEEEKIEENPFHRIRVKFREKKTLPRIIPRKEIERLLNFMYQKNTRKERMWMRDISVIEICFATGIRVGELSHIKADDIDLDTGLIRIMGKGGRERYAQIESAQILSLLNQYYKENRKAIAHSGYFFVNQRKKRFSEQSVRLMLRKYTKLAGIERKITPHMFRHSFATYLIEEGADSSYVQELLGHSSIKTTQIYIHLAMSKKAEILRELHPRNHMKIIYAA